MPELPEVETTRRGIMPHIQGKLIQQVTIRDARLRWPVPEDLKHQLTNKTLLDITRRGKYLLFQFENGTMLLHLGMSGSLRIDTPGMPYRKHDHVELVFGHNTALRLHDPRRFGSVHWTRDDPMQHELLEHLGPEPLSRSFNADYLYALSRKRKVAIKQFIMNSQIVVGVGNIYASEALFMAGIHPKRLAGKISRQRYGLLVDAIKKILRRSIKQGGTTLRDFLHSDGQPGYFKQQLLVYDRKGEPCKLCGESIAHIVQGQRSTFFCKTCQT